ncbi:MAG: type II toxin-antitoxin system HicA family toxin [Gemmatimonadetes bacterium]|nr:type II toxin-antitoxin system HicA family toxin [Gemmatimonadota bacterium]MBI2537921.1 type II toxin-antitoxin system HicA family toxin [Gemmatimonadota bacterium]
MKVKEIASLLEHDGWYLVAFEGSHRQYQHPVKRGRVTVAGKLGHDLSPGTLRSILRQAGLVNPRRNP